MLKKSMKNKIVLIEVLPNTYTKEGDEKGFKILNAYNTKQKQVFAAKMHENTNQDLSFLKTYDHMICVVKLKDRTDPVWVTWKLKHSDDLDDVMIGDMQICNDKEINVLNSLFPQWLKQSVDLYKSNAHQHFYNDKYRR